MAQRILIAVAHPDDEVLGAGGTIARHVREGDEVYCLILSEGVTSRYSRRAEAEEKLKQLKSETAKAAKILGIKRVFFKDFPDNRFDTVPLLTIVKAVEEVKEEIKPEVIYTHHGGDLNIDHVIVHRAVLTATRPITGHSVREIYAFEVPSSTEWAFGQFQHTFRPNVFVDISATLENKVQAMALYKSEARPFPHPRSPRVIDAIARRWGSVVGCEAAEAFELIRTIR